MQKQSKLAHSTDWLDVFLLFVFVIVVYLELNLRQRLVYFEIDSSKSELRALIISLTVSLSGRMDHVQY